MPELISLTVGDPPDVWSALGFDVLDGRCRVGRINIVFDPAVGKGVRRWAMAGATSTPPLVEGLPTEWVDWPGEAGATEHANGIIAIDHVVLFSPDVDRTLGVLTGLGFDARRERLTDTYGTPMRQVFLRAGETILELVGGQDANGEGAARIYGLAFTSRDLDATAAYLGERLHPPKDAVQPGRRIATVDKLAGSTIPIAVMSPAPHHQTGSDDD